MAVSHQRPLQTIISAIRTAQKDIVPSTPELDEAVRNSDAHGLPHITINAAQGQLLNILCQSINAQRVLEVGTLGGYSTLWLANSSPTTKVTSIEMDAKHRDVAQENLTSVRERVEIVQGKALEVMVRLKEDGKVFDLVLIDADWGGQGAYYDLAVQMTRKGGIVYVDNAVLNLVGFDGREKQTQGLIEKVKGDQRVFATLIPTVRVEKEDAADNVADGFLVAYVK